MLVVEDDVRNIFALSSMLEPKGAKVEIARNGREAIEALDAEHRAGRQGIDLVLMDIMMPEMDGLDRHARDPPAARVEEAADHRAHGQGDEGRSGAVPRRRRQRLHRQAARRGEAAVAGPRLDAEVERAATPKDFDIELRLLLDAIYLKYHYDFRGYAMASLKRRLRTRDGALRLSRRCRSCRTACSTIRRVFPALLEFLTVQVSDMFRDPAYFRALRERVRAGPADLSVAEDLGGGLQHRRRGVLAGDPAARGGTARHAR